MNLIADTWRQLVRRRLWPVAVLLVAALAAVPFVLAKNPAPVEPPAPTPQPETTAAEAAATGDPVVALVEEGDYPRRRRVLGARKDPFAPAPLPRARRSQNQEPDPATPATPELPTVPTDPIGGGTPSIPTPSLPPIEPPAEPEPKKKTYPPDALIVRFGDAAGGELQRMTLAKLEPLPQSTDVETEPVLVYTGLSKDGKSAIFMVDDAAEATGDGECKPHPSSCETIHLRKGETEFFDIEDEAGEVVAQYQLDLIDIKTDKKPSATRARANTSAKRASLDSPGL
jgi:hypothetical protein